MGVDITVGQTEHAIKEISKKGFDKDQAAGIHHKELIFTLEAIKEIINNFIKQSRLVFECCEVD